VIDDFRAALPDATIYVFDNASTDRTAAIAAARGAVVIPEPRKGKGYVIEYMLDQVDADAYVMVDGDDTYEASEVHRLLAPVLAGQADMVVGSRVAPPDPRQAFRPLHVAGNRLVRGLINVIYGCRLTDILSGYRAFGRRVVERVPVVSSGFEVETEMTIQVLYYRLKMIEVPVPYRGRPAGSVSKLRTFHDGFRVLWTIFTLLRAVKPLTFFGLIGLLLFGLAALAGTGPLLDYVATRAVGDPALAILSTALVLLAFGSIFLGVLLHAVNWRLLELHNVIVRGARDPVRREARDRRRSGAAGG
jgi:glycosyltransferase involved in cell wall biosynthesis